jgi:hypothetical protein
VWDFEITQGWALGALALMTIPSVMIALSVLLPAKANQRTNIVVASLFILMSIGNAIGETWAFIWLGAIIEVVLLATIVRSLGGAEGQVLRSCAAGPSFH